VVTAGPARFWIGVGAVCFSLLCPAQAWAKTGGFFTTLAYEPAPSCPTAEALEAIVVARLGYDPFTPVAPHHVSLSVTQSGSALNGRLEWRDAQGKWTGDQSFSMANGDCARLIRTVGLALAVQIQLLGDSSAAERDSERAPEEKPAAVEPEQTLDAKPRTKSAPESAGERPKASDPHDGLQAGRPSQGSPRAEPRLRPAIGAGPTIAFGVAPHPLLLGSAFGALAWHRTSIELGAALSLPAVAHRSDGAGVSVKFLLLSAAPCQAIERWNACLLVHAGQVSMAGRGIDRPTSTHLPFVAAGARAAFVQSLGPRAFIRVRADGLAILTRWTAKLDDVPVWTMPMLGLTFGIDAGVQFR
jgi:hypothetical protein